MSQSKPQQQPKPKPQTQTRGKPAPPAPRAKKAPKSSPSTGSSGSKPKQKHPLKTLGMSQSEIKEYLMRRLRPDLVEPGGLATTNPIPVRSVKTKIAVDLVVAENEVGEEITIVTTGSPETGIVIKNAPATTLKRTLLRSKQRIARGRRPLHRWVKLERGPRGRMTLANAEYTFTGSTGFNPGFVAGGESYVMNGDAGAGSSAWKATNAGAFTGTTMTKVPVDSYVYIADPTPTAPLGVLPLVPATPGSSYDGGAVRSLGSEPSFSFHGVTSLKYSEAVSGTSSAAGALTPVSLTIESWNTITNTWEEEEDGGYVDYPGGWAGSVAKIALDPTVYYRIHRHGLTAGTITSQLNVSSANLQIGALSSGDNVAISILSPDADLLEDLSSAYRHTSTYLEARYTGSSLENGGQIATGIAPPEAINDPDSPTLPTMQDIREWPASNFTRLSEAHGVASRPFGPENHNLNAFDDLEQEAFSAFPMQVMSIIPASPQTTAVTSTSLWDVATNSQILSAGAAYVAPALAAVTEAVLGAATDKLTSTNAITKKPESVIRRLMDAVLMGLSGNLGGALAKIGDMLF